MQPSVDQLKATLAGLPSADRAELAHYLLDSLDTAEDDASSAWHDELNRRVEEIRNGKAVGTPLEVVIAELRERYP